MMRPIQPHNSLLPPPLPQLIRMPTLIQRSRIIMRRTETRLVQIRKTSLQPPILPLKLNPSRISSIPRFLGKFIICEQIVDGG